MLMKFLIDFKDDASEDDISNYLNSNALTIEKVYDSFLKTYLVQGEVSPPLSELVERVVADSNAPIRLVTDSVVSIKLTSDETDNIVFATDDDSSWWKLAVQIKPDLTGADQVVQRRGETATVYIVDSGIKKELEEFEGVDITDLYSFTGDFTDNKGHGTALASVISGRTCGLTNSKLKSVKIFEEGVDTLQSHLLAAFDAIITDVEANPNTFPVVNLSWVIDVNEFIENKIQALINNGIFVIVAAGNGAGPITNLTPARMSSVCTVGAYGPSLSPSPFSNYTESWESPALDVFAPGENIKVVGLDGSYSIVQGTSVACAIQTAAAAYNSFLAVLSDGTPVEAPSTSSFLTASCFTISSLMQLEPPFNFCTKQITRFTTQLMGENGARYPRLGVLNLRATIGENVKLLAFYPAAYKEVEAVLPPGLELSNGWIHGVPETTEPAGYTGQITFTLWDNTTTTIDYNIAVVPETVPTTDDPVINLVLSLPADCVATGPGEPSCWGSCSLTGQSPPCSYCDGGGKSGSSTICRCEGSNICP